MANIALAMPIAAINVKFKTDFIHLVYTANSLNRIGPKTSGPMKRG
jgi:hypothetical protein